MVGYFRVKDNVAVEAFTTPDGVGIADCFAPAIAETFKPRGSEAQVGWHWTGSGFVQPPPITATKDELVAYAAAKQVAVRDGGIVVDVGTSGAPVSVDVASNGDGRGLVTGCVQLVNLAQQYGQPAPTFRWVNDDGSKLTLTAAQIMVVAYALGAHVQSTYDVLGDVNAAIGSGTVTTIAQVDAAGWPAVRD